MQIKRGELADLGIVIEKMNIKGAKFSYALVKNKKKIDKELEIIQETINMETSKEEIELNDARIKLLEKHSHKDEEWKAKLKIDPIMKRQVYDVKDIKKYNEAYKELEKKHSKAVELMKKRKEDIDKLLEEKVEIDFHLIKEDAIPEDITPQQLIDIAVLID